MGRKVPLPLIIDTLEVQQLDARAQQEGVSRSHLLNTGIARCIDRPLLIIEVFEALVSDVDRPIKEGNGQTRCSTIDEDYIPKLDTLARRMKLSRNVLVSIIAAGINLGLV